MAATLAAGGHPAQCRSVLQCTLGAARRHRSTEVLDSQAGPP
jgi:hypothetical protein